MKNNFTLCCILFSFSFAFAQTSAVDRGAVIMSGMASYNSQGGDLFKDSKGNRFNIVTLAPNLNIFIVPNISLGIGLAYNKQSQGDSSLSSLSFGPSIGYFTGEPGSNSYPYVSAGIHYTRIGETNKITGSDFIIAAGAISAIRKHAGIVIEASIHMLKLKGENWNKSVSGNVFMIGIGVAGLIF
jgi:hypothetical protein